METPSTSTNVKQTSSVHDVRQEQPPFGSRLLTEDQDVWSQNAWDHVPPPSDQTEIIETSIAKQRSAPVPAEEHRVYNDRPKRHWDEFYKSNTSNFFKNRNWLSNEFPELVEALSPDAGPKVIAELGCGAGNAVFPLYEANQNDKATFKAYDYAAHGVKLVQQNPLYTSAPPGKLSAAVWDITSDTLPSEVEPESVDIIVLVFVLSALHPDEWPKALRNMHLMLKPGGVILLRDYGRYDLTQLRFKTNRLLDDNFYVRGDKTRVYFFDLNELALLFSGSKFNKAPTVTETVDDELDVEDSRTTPTPPPFAPTPSTIEEPEYTIHPSLPFTPLISSHPLFDVARLGVDRRLIVNRARKVKMYRVWMQGVFQKVKGDESKDLFPEIL
ncbi:methyltransferase [Flagelloscypha sp. PMI_526]|nr:methyltransferase [Flagelloscypha sp. PMI_526]